MDGRTDAVGAVSRTDSQMELRGKEIIIRMTLQRFRVKYSLLQLSEQSNKLPVRGL
jgi:hypothetical protein